MSSALVSHLGTGERQPCCTIRATGLAIRPPLSQGSFLQPQRQAAALGQCGIVAASLEHEISAL